MRRTQLSFIFILFKFSTALIRSPIYRFKTSSKPLFDSYRDDENKGLSLKVVGTLAILTLGVFGTGFLGSAQSFLRELGNPNTVQTTENKLKGSKIENRGALTRLTKREMNEKLQNIPVFFVSADSGKSIYTVDGVGSFFEELDDATKFAATNKDAKLTVSATSLNDVYFTLLDRQTKLGKFITGVAQESDPAATYVLRANDKQYSSTSDKYKASHTINDYPLYRVPNLVFTKEDGLEVPLFLRREDAATSFDRLQEAKKTAASTPTGIVQEEFQIQEVSLLDIMKLFQTGGFESRALEFYPSIDSITEARRLMGLPLE